jgi:hypothetical protein
MFPERTYCVLGLFKAKEQSKFRSTKVDSGKLKRKYLNRPWSALAVKVLKYLVGMKISFLRVFRSSQNNYARENVIYITRES